MFAISGNSINANEGKLTSTGFLLPVSASTGNISGTFLLKINLLWKKASVADKIALGSLWTNPISEEHFNKIIIQSLEILKGKRRVIRLQGFARRWTAITAYQFKLLTNSAWHNFICTSIFIVHLRRVNDSWIRVHNCFLHRISKSWSQLLTVTNSEAFIMVSFGKNASYILSGTE